MEALAVIENDTDIHFLIKPTLTTTGLDTGPPKVLSHQPTRETDLVKPGPAPEESTVPVADPHVTHLANAS